MEQGVEQVRRVRVEASRNIWCTVKVGKVPEGYIRGVCWELPQEGSHYGLYRKFSEVFASEEAALVSGLREVEAAMRDKAVRNSSASDQKAAVALLGVIIAFMQNERQCALF